MQVFVFAGTKFYPRPHLGDLIGTLPYVPYESALSALLLKRLQDPQLRDDLNTGAYDWLCLLVVNPDGSAERHAWSIERAPTSDALMQDGCASFFKFEDAWHGLRPETDLPALSLDGLKA